jgi:type II secretory pathway pseudopilin PulG
MHDGGRAHAPARGLTLVETVVALAIIMLVAGLTVTAGSAVSRRADVSSTRTTLDLLDTALQEWEHAADRTLTWGHDPGDGDVWSYRAFPLIITEVLEKIRRHDATESTLARIEPDRIYTYEQGVIPPWIDTVFANDQIEDFYGAITVLDAWGTPVYATHPGALMPRGTADTDPDGTERTYNEQYFGAARRRTMCFVSAGPDRAFGNLHLTTKEADLTDLQRREIEQTRDNVYSYRPLGRPEKAPDDDHESYEWQ